MLIGMPKSGPRLIFLVTVGYRRMQRSVEQKMLAENGLTSAQSGVLFFLGSNDGALIGDISASLDLVPSAVTGLADRMERAGLIQRKRDDDDGRVQRVYLTEIGRKIRQRAVAQARIINAILMEGFSDNEIEVVSRWLTSLQTKFTKDNS